MRSETLAILTLADGIPNFSRQQLLKDLEQLIKQGQYYTTAEVAQRYAVTKQTILNWEKSARLVPSLRVSDGCTRYSSADLAEFEEKHYPGKRK